MNLILLSPAKSLNWEDHYSGFMSVPEFYEESRKVNTSVKRLSKSKLMDLQKISRPLAELNWQRNQEWSSLPFSNSRPAIFAFDGDVYQGLDAKSLTDHELQRANTQLRILSGLYGVLKPLDSIQPYRLEMGTRLKVRRSDNLYSFWKDKVTKNISQELGDEGILFNLASKEYFKVIDTRSISNRIIEFTFLDKVKEDFRMMSFYGKKARGSMARYLIQENIETLEQIKDFNADGYIFSEERSTSDNMVFLNDRTAK